MRQKRDLKVTCVSLRCLQALARLAAPTCVVSELYTTACGASHQDRQHWCVGMPHLSLPGTSHFLAPAPLLTRVQAQDLRCTPTAGSSPCTVSCVESIGLAGVHPPGLHGIEVANYSISNTGAVTKCRQPTCERESVLSSAPPRVPMRGHVGKQIL